MTKPRVNPGRLLFGLIGSFEDTSAQKSYWNKKFYDEGIDAFMDHYPTKASELPERLSEMFHFDRRGYIVGKALQEAILPLLDRVEGEGSVAVVANKNGICIGYSETHPENVWSIWIENM
tara:strand:+ start:590 stop:949 length:360 start_codon:yes stop_codon:yes gene_type:complete